MKVSIAPFAFGFSLYMLCSCFCFYQNFILSFFSSCFLNVSLMTADVGKKIKMLTYILYIDCSWTRSHNCFLHMDCSFEPYFCPFANSKHQCVDTSCSDAAASSFEGL
jgi:hypothetical protein